MAHYTLIARINAGNGRFPFVNVQFTKTHRPIPIAGATYYLRRSGGARTPIRIGNDLAAAHVALLHMDDREIPNGVREVTLRTPSNKPVGSQRKTVVDAAREYLERSKQKSRKTYIGYRTAVNLFAQSCKKTYFDEIRRDDMLDYVYLLRTYKSAKTGSRFGESAVFNYFLKTMVFLNDRGIARLESQGHMRRRRSSQRSRRVLSDSHDHGARVFAAREPEVHHVYGETEQRGPDHHARPHEVQKGDIGYRQALQLERGI